MSGWAGVLGTAVVAVLVFVAGQVLQRFVLEPIQEQRRLIGEVAHALLFYANRGPMGVKLGTYTVEDLHEASRHLRDLAGRLRSSLFFVPYYDTMARLGWVPARGNVLEAAAALTGWSNGVLSESSDNRTRQQHIAEKLGIDRRMDVG
jgi:hypothetical protein